MSELSGVSIKCTCRPWSQQQPGRRCSPGRSVGSKLWCRFVTELLAAGRRGERKEPELLTSELEG